MKKSILFFCVASLFIATGTTDAALIQNGSFEIPGASGTGEDILIAIDTQITGWTVGSGSIGYLGGSEWQAAEGTSFIDMTGLSLFGPGIISQSFETVAGAMYEVIFAMAGYPDSVDPLKSLEVLAPGFDQVYTFDTTNKSPTNMGWINVPFTFTATDVQTALTFTGLDENTNFGATIDNVQVNLANGGGAPVPEPATMLLLGAGLTGLALFGRKRLVA